MSRLCGSFRMSFLCGGLLLIGLPSESRAQCFSFVSPSVTITCENTVDTMPTHGKIQQVLKIVNNTGNWEDVQVNGWTCPGGTCNMPLTSIFLDPYDSTRVIFSYESSSTPGSRVLQFDLWVDGMYGVLYKSISVQDLTTLTPGGELRPYLTGPTGTAASYAHSTVPYITMDQPRSLTLVHQSDRAAFLPVVGADVLVPTHSSGISDITLRVNATGGANILFTNGDTTLRFTGALAATTYYYGWDNIYGDCLEPWTWPDLAVCRVPTVGDSVARLYGQLDLRSQASGILPVTLTVVITYLDSTTDTKVLNTRLLVVNDGVSPLPGLPYGWAVGGLQRLYVGATGHGYMISEGGGPTVWYSGLGVAALDYSILTYDGGTLTYTRTYRNGTKAVFSASGQQTAFTDVFNNTVKYTYDGSGHLTTVEDPVRVHRNAGTYLALSYTSGRLASVTEAGGSAARATTYTVTTDTLRSITDPDNLSSAFTYDAAGRLRRVTDRRGGIRAFGYQSGGGHLVSDSLPQVPVDAGGGTTTNQWPIVQYRPWTVKLPQTSTTVTAAAFVMRDTVPDIVTDPIGRVTRIYTNVLQQPERTVNARGDTTSVVYEGLFPKTIRISNGNIDSLVYTDGVLTAEKPAWGNWTYYHYGVFAQVDSVWGDEVRYQRRFLDNTTGRVDSVRTVRLNASADTVSVTLKTTYDSWGRVVRTTSALQRSDSVAYDATTGNATQSWIQGVPSMTWTFDVYGRVATTTAIGQSTTTNTYDLFNRVTAIDNGVDTAPTRFRYDALYRIAVRNPKGEVADSVAVDALGRITTRYDNYNPALTQTYRYDAAGQLTSSTNRRGQSVDRQYDLLGNLTSRRYGSTADTLTTFPISGGMMQVFANAEARDTVTTMPQGRWRYQRTRMNGQWVHINRWTATAFGSRDSVIATSSSQDTADWFALWVTQYNAYTGLPEWVDSDHAGYARLRYLGYTLDDQPEWLRYGSLGTPPEGGILYTSRGQVSAHGTSGLAAAAQYDSLSRVRAMVGTGTRSAAFAYDGLGRLIADTTAVTAPCNYNPPSAIPDSAFSLVQRCTSPIVTTYSYDAAGNRTDGGSTYLAGNRIEQFHGDTVEHDNDGNITRRYNRTIGKDRRYGWDELGRLIRVFNTVTGDSVRYFYDALDRLVRRATNGVTDRYWIWEGDNIFAECDSLMQPLLAYYYDGTDRPAIAVSQWTLNYGIAYYPQINAAGNVIGWVNDYGTLVKSVSYDPWGVPTISGADTVATLLWKGLHREAGMAVGASGLYYMRARWYDPELGRFLSEDPAGIEGGLSLYAFGGNDPINRRDPSGLKVCFASLNPDPRQAQKEIDELSKATADGVDATFRLDGGNCIDYESIRVRSWSTLIEGFLELAKDPGRIDVRFVEGSAQGTGLSKANIGIQRWQIGSAYGTAPTKVPNKCTTSPGANWDLPSIIVHELGHLYATISDAPLDTNIIAVDWENVVHARKHRPLRSQQCHVIGS